MAAVDKGQGVGPVMMDLEGLELTPRERDQLQQACVGGVILFSRNIQSAQQVRELNASIRALDANVLIAVDQEGGRVQRVRDGVSRIPPMRQFGQRYLKEPNTALEDAEAVGWLMAAEMLSLGFDFSFAPVLDIDYGRSEVIGDRAFSGDVNILCDVAKAWVSGMRRAGMAATGKHFPGHGWVKADSHTDTPMDAREFGDIKRSDLVPFDSLIRTGLQAIMPAHVIYEQLDAKPAGFSKYWLQDVLRGELGFGGVIFSDDLSMEGAAVVGGFPQRCDAALEAGCDMVLVCNAPAAADEVIAHISAREMPFENKRLSSMFGKECDLWSKIVQSDTYLEARERLARYEV